VWRCHAGADLDTNTRKPYPARPTEWFKCGDSRLRRLSPRRQFRHRTVDDPRLFHRLPWEAVAVSRIAGYILPGLDTIIMRTYSGLIQESPACIDLTRCLGHLGRQGEMKCCSSSIVSGRPQPPPMRLHNGTADSQSMPLPCGLPRNQRSRRLSRSSLRSLAPLHSKSCFHQQQAPTIGSTP
jgi:hypothetical protein